jgi:hypothetical protein
MMKEKKKKKEFEETERGTNGKISHHQSFFKLTHKILKHQKII